MQSSDHHVSVGLVYQAAAANAHLKQALADLGADVVYDAPASSFDFGALDASGAEVVIVNLDPEVEEFDALGDLLADEKRRVVINDGEVSSKLSGWDQARWARHLAAKILGEGDLNPPRPEGAQAIPVAAKPVAPPAPAAAPAAPPAPAEPSVAPSDEPAFEISADDLERALAADTKHALAATKAELVTALEPKAIALQDREESLREAGHAVGLEEVPELDATPVERAAPSSTGFTMLDDEPAMTVSGEGASDEPGADFGDFGGLLLESLDESAAEAPAAKAAAPEAKAAALDDFDLDGFSLEEEIVETEEKPTAGAERKPEPAASALDDFDLSGFALEPETEAPADDGKPGASAAPKPVAAAPSVADDFDLGGFSLEPLEEPEPHPEERLASLQKIAARAAPTVEIPLAELQKAQRHSAPTVQIPVAEIEKAKAAAQAPADDFDLGGFSLEPLTEEPAAGPAPTPSNSPVQQTAPKTPGPATPSSEWDAIGAFSLEPTEADSAAVPSAPPPAKSAAAPTPKPVEEDWGDLGDFSLESMTDESAPSPSATPPAKAASAPLPAKAASAAPAPAAKQSAPQPTPSPESNAALAGLDLEFASPGDTFKFSDFSAEPEPAPNVEPDDELMKQFQAIFDDQDYTPPLEAGPVQRVWVLGASIGGPEAVREFLAALPPGLPVLFLLAQHMGSDFVDLMTQQLSKATRYKVRHVGDGDAAAHGEVLIVPLNERLRVSPSGECRISALEQVSSYTPSIDTVLKDVADAFGKNAGAIIFSGMAHDAIEGAKYLHAKGGQVWAQDQKTCVVSSMVDGAVEAGVVTVKAAPAELAQRFGAAFAGK